MLVGTLVVATLIYLTYSCCGTEYFATYNMRPSTQRMFTVDDQPHDRVDDPGRAEGFINARYDAYEGADKVQRGAYIPSQGVATEKFVEFARLEDIDDRRERDLHQPKTSDDELISIAY